MNKLPCEAIELVLQQTKFDVVKNIAKVRSNNFWVSEASNHVVKRAELTLELDFMPKEDQVTVEYRQTRLGNCSTVTFNNRPDQIRSEELKFVELSHVLLKGDERIPAFGEIEVEDHSGEEYEAENDHDYPEGALDEFDLDDYEDGHSNSWQEEYDRWRDQQEFDSDDGEYENDYDDDDDDYKDYPGVVGIVPPSPKAKIPIEDSGLRQSLSLFALRDMTQFKESNLIIDSFTEELYPQIGGLIDLLQGNFAHLTLHNLVGYGSHLNALLGRCLTLDCLRHLNITFVDLKSLDPDLLFALIQNGSLMTFHFEARIKQKTPIFNVDQIVELSEWWASGAGEGAQIQQLEIRFGRPNWRTLRSKLEDEGEKKERRSTFELVGDGGNITFQLKDGMLIMMFHRL